MRGDDDSDTSSIRSSVRPSKGRSASIDRAPPSLPSKGASKATVSRPVSKLRPKAPLSVPEDSNLLEVAKLMVAQRADAALLVGTRGRLSGIVTDNDITKRVVSKGVDPSSTAVSAVMTKGPKCVSLEDSAVDALELMVDNRFRHLPVLDRDGAVVGLLDIAKCLYDAISIMEKVQKKQEAEGKGGADATSAAALSLAMKKVMGSKGGGNRAQLAAMQALMDNMFGGSVPTLRSIIGDHEFVHVSPGASVLEASQVMAEERKGVLVMDGDELVGILTPKDLLNRVVAKELSTEDVTVEEVMTAHPACVSADLTLLDAMREMHDQKFLHLPVREEGSGRVLGLLNVMDLMCSTCLLYTSPSPRD